MASSKTPTGKRTGNIYASSIGSLLKSGKFNAVSSSLPLLANGGSPLAMAAQAPQEAPQDLNQKLLEIAESVMGGGYAGSETGSEAPFSVEHAGSTVLDASEGGTSASGYTLAVVLKALQEQGLSDKLTAKELQNFQKAWTGADSRKKNGVASTVTALEKFRLGRGVPPEEAMPGDIIQIQRKDGSTQTGIFKEWVTDPNGNQVGIRYRSSQESTQGVGDNIEYFDKGIGIDPDNIAISRVGETPSEAPVEPPVETAPTPEPAPEELMVEEEAPVEEESAPEMPVDEMPAAPPKFAAGGLMGMAPILMQMLQRNNKLGGAGASAAAQNTTTTVPPPPPVGTDPGAGMVESAMAQMADNKRQGQMDSASSYINMGSAMLGTFGTAAAYGPDGRVDPRMTALASGASGMAMGADLGKALGPWGMAGGAALGAAIGAGAGFVTGKDQEAKFLQKRMDEELARVRNAAVRPRAYQEGGPAMTGNKAKPIQAEAGEEFLTPDLQIASTKATKRHVDMAPGEITDVVPNGTYIFSDQLQFRPFDLADNIVARGVSFFSETENHPTHVYRFRDVFGDSNKPMTFAEAARLIRKKFPVVNDTSDPLSQVTDIENKQTRMAFLAKLVELQQRRNGRDQPLPKMGEVPIMAEGGCPDGQEWDPQLKRCVPTAAPPPPTPEEDPSYRDQPPSDGSAPPPPAEQPPADGTQTPPADGTQTPPADGTQTPPADGTQTPPADGTQTPPADGTQPPAAEQPAQPPAEVPAPRRRSDLIGDVTNKYLKVYEDFVKLNDAQNAQSSADYKRLYGELNAMNAASTLNNVLGTMAQDSNVTPARVGSTLADAMFAPTPETRIGGIVDQLKSSRDNIVRDIIAAGVPPGQAAIMASDIINDTMKEEGALRAQFAERQTELDRQRYAFLQTVRDTNEQARVQAENESRDLANKKIAQMTSHIQDGLSNAGELRKAALETRRALFREKMANYYDTVNKMYGTEMAGTSARIWQDYQDDVAQGIEAERKARLEMLQGAIQGTQGAQGTQEVTGPQGTQGVQAPAAQGPVTGVQGAQGPVSGTQGVQGPQGTYAPSSTEGGAVSPTEAAVGEQLAQDTEAQTIMDEIVALEDQIATSDQEVTQAEADSRAADQAATAAYTAFTSKCGEDVEYAINTSDECRQLYEAYRESERKAEEASARYREAKGRRQELETKYRDLDAQYKEKAKNARDAIVPGIPYEEIDNKVVEELKQDPEAVKIEEELIAAEKVIQDSKTKYDELEARQDELDDVVDAAIVDFREKCGRELAGTSETGNVILTVIDPATLSEECRAIKERFDAAYAERAKIVEDKNALREPWQQAADKYKELDAQYRRKAESVRARLIDEYANTQRASAQGVQGTQGTQAAPGAQTVQGPQGAGIVSEPIDGPTGQGNIRPSSTGNEPPSGDPADYGFQGADGGALLAPEYIATQIDPNTIAAFTSAMPGTEMYVTVGELYQAAYEHDSIGKELEAVSAEVTQLESDTRQMGEEFMANCGGDAAMGVIDGTIDPNSPEAAELFYPDGERCKELYGKISENLSRLVSLKDQRDQLSQDWDKSRKKYQDKLRKFRQVEEKYKAKKANNGIQSDAITEEGGASNDSPEARSRQDAVAGQNDNEARQAPDSQQREMSPAEAQRNAEAAGSLVLPSSVTTRSLMDEAAGYAGSDNLGDKVRQGFSTGKSAGACGRASKAIIGALTGVDWFTNGKPFGHNPQAFTTKGGQDLSKTGIYQKKQAMPSGYMNDSKQWRVGDVIVTTASDGGPGHMQVWTGKEWVSDFPQGQKILTGNRRGVKYGDFTLYRLNDKGIEAVRKKHGIKAAERGSNTPESRGIRSEPIESRQGYKSQIDEKAPNVSRILSKPESGDDYNKLYAGAERDKFKNIKVTEMTLAELDKFTDPNGEYGQYVKNKSREKKVSTPLGRYQYVGRTLMHIAKQMGLSSDTKFTPEVQDKIFLFHVKSIIKKYPNKQKLLKVLRDQWVVLQKASDNDILQMVDEISSI